MNASIQADDLKAAVRVLRRVAPKRPTLEILSHFLIESRDREIHFNASDLEIHVRRTLATGCRCTGSTVCAESAPLIQAATAADKGTSIHISLAGENLVIRYVRKKLTITARAGTKDPGDFPARHTTTGTPFIMPRATLAAMTGALNFVGRDETRHVLCGAHLDPLEGGQVVATDGRRLVCTPARVPAGGAIVPTAVLKLLKLPEFAGPAVWHRSAKDEHVEDFAALTFGAHTVLTFKLTDGNYPDWRQIMPRPEHRTGTIAFSADTAGGLGPWLREMGKGAHPRVTLEPDKPASTVSITSATGDTVDVPAGIVDAPGSISFNPSFLADFLASDLRTLDVIDEMSPAMITDGLTRGVLMPMRLEGPGTRNDAAEASEDEETEEQEPDDADPEAVEVEAEPVTA